MDSLYRFRSKECSRCDHQLWAYAASDDDLQVARPKAIIEAFEKRYMVGARWDEFQRRNIKIQYRLLGFDGMRLWQNGTLHFAIRSPSIPFFGTEASRLCPNVPIMYRSIADNKATPWRFFVNGQEFNADEIPLAYREKFGKLMQVKSGFIPGRLTLESFFS